MEQSGANGTQSEPTWRFVEQYLWIALVVALGSTLALTGYNLSRQADLQHAEQILERSGARQLMDAYVLLAEPHIFGGWQRAETVMPDEPALSGLSEAQLFSAVVAAPEHQGRDSSGETQANCGGDADCIWSGMVLGETTMPRIRLWFYLRLRYALRTGAMIEPAAQKLFSYHPSLFVAAVEKQVQQGQCTFGEGADTPVRALLENLRQSVRNTWVFVQFCGLVSCLFLVTALAWYRSPWRMRSSSVAY